jgi:hypothetical protein
MARNTPVSQAAAALAKRKQSWIPFVTPGASRAGHTLAEARKSHRASTRSPASKAHKSAKAHSGRKAAHRTGTPAHMTARTGRSMNVSQAGKVLRKARSK